MYNGNEVIILLILPHSLSGPANPLPIHRSGILGLDKTSDHLGHSHCELAAKSVHLALVVLGYDILTSRKGTEPDNGIE